MDLSSSLRLVSGRICFVVVHIAILMGFSDFGHGSNENSPQARLNKTASIGTASIGTASIGTAPEVPVQSTLVDPKLKRLGSANQGALKQIQPNSSTVNPPATGDSEIEGLVRVKGTSYTVKVHLTEKDNYKGHLLCSGEKARRIAKLSALTVKASGTWKSEGTKRCFAVASFTVTKMASGRLAVVGLLEKSVNVFQINADHGTSYRFDSVPDGLREMVGQRVILDVKTLGSRTNAEPSQRIVSYAKYP